MSPIIEAMKPSPNSDRQSCASSGELFPKNGTAFATESPTTFVSSRPTIFGSSRRTRYNRENNREFCRIWRSTVILASDQRADSIAYSGIPCATEQGISKRVSGKIFQGTGNFRARCVSVHCLHACFAPAERDLFSLAFFAGEEEQMADGERSRERYGEAFWRAHHEAWRQSDLNQREDCEAQGLPLKAFGNC